MIEIFYTPTFIREYDKLSQALKDEVKEKIAVFEEDPFSRSLRFHKLKGHMKKCCSFSVNYSYRVIVQKDAEGVYALLSVGDHDIYN